MIQGMKQEDIEKLVQGLTGDVAKLLLLKIVRKLG